MQRHTHTHTHRDHQNRSHTLTHTRAIRATTLKPLHNETTTHQGYDGSWPSPKLATTHFDHDTPAVLKASVYLLSTGTRDQKREV
ncbi:hypothetical protein Pcinc_021734 [Petrolisthes cinctipes]|uniref:Uncharacterized protein n=1 Tax=Petrolisthes cinctipes TaxID=88211 RepID=A0AAE1KHZ5_PETCI|nr:hypothetical protein Pcinc_021734 [Petrolisthes cinctipes]